MKETKEQMFARLREERIWNDSQHSFRDCYGVYVWDAYRNLTRAIFDCTAWIAVQRLSRAVELPE